MGCRVSLVPRPFRAVEYTQGWDRVYIKGEYTPGVEATVVVGTHPIGMLSCLLDIHGFW